MINSAMEFHDSEVERITQEGDNIRVSFVEVYIHKSEGQPGIDPGTGWVQKAEMLLENASIEGRAPDLPRWLDGGSISVDGKTYDNMVLFPSGLRGDVLLVLDFVSGEKVEISAKGISLSLIGEPKYVEEFPRD